MRHNMLFLGLLWIGATSGYTDSVGLPPSIRIPATRRKIFYKEGDNMTLPCQASGHPAPQYGWLKGSAVVVSGVAGEDGTLGLRSLTATDAGLYYCRAGNVNGVSVSPPATLIMAHGGEYNYASIMHHNVGEGPLRVRCAVPQGVPREQARWQTMTDLDDPSPANLTTSRRVTVDEHGFLHFSYLILSDALPPTTEGGTNGLYRCSMVNSYLGTSTVVQYARIIFREHEPGRAQARATHPTIAYSTRSPFAIGQGEDMKLQCIFTGRPEVDVTWSAVPAGRGRIEDSGRTLVITDVQPEDTGHYRCTGKNSVGSTAATIVLTVHAKPKFECQPSSQNVTEGESAEFCCRTTDVANQVTVITWMRNAETIEGLNSSGRMELRKDVGLLVIHDVCKSECGGSNSTDMMVVQCWAENRQGVSHSQGYLGVLRKTELTKVPSNLTLNITEGEEAMFECDASTDAATPLSFSWELSGVPLIDTEDPRKIFELGTLKLNLTGLECSARKSYQGAYRCRASNGYSSATAAATLTIACTPDTSGVRSPLGGGLACWWCHVMLFHLIYKVWG